VPGLTAPRLKNSVQRRVVAAFTDHLALKATAIFLAIVLWFVVNAKEPQIELVTVRFAPSLLDSSLVLREPLPQIQAIVAGSPKQLIQLSTNPPTIRRQITADSPDTLVLDLRPEDVVLPEGVDAVVRDVQPRSLTLRFESTWNRKVPVMPEGIEIVAAPVGGMVRAQFEPAIVQISGPRQLVAQIASVRTNKTTILYPDSQTHLVDIDTTALGAGVRVRPTQVKVQLTVAPAVPAHP
jgi:YbbR domain-containing protein